MTIDHKFYKLISLMEMYAIECTKETYTEPHPSLKNAFGICKDMWSNTHVLGLYVTVCGHAAMPTLRD